MVELFPVGGGLCGRGHADDPFKMAWQLAQALAGRARVGFVSRVGHDALSDAFVAELAADGSNVSGIGRDLAHGMGLYLIELDGVERSFRYWRSMSATRLLATDEATRLLGHGAVQSVACGWGFAGQVIRHFGAKIPKSSTPDVGSYT